MRAYDVLVIGAGPAGSAAAAAAAGEGASVIMLEKKREIGVPVQCAEHIPFQVAAEFAVAGEITAQSVDGMRTHLPDGEVVDTAAKGVICNRQLFDQHLAGLAADAGAGLLTGTRVTGIEPDGVVIASASNRELRFRAATIIGADGPVSAVRRWMGIKPNALVQGRQYVMALNERLNMTEIYFRGWIPGGYGWVFPKGKTANVGVGVDRRFGVDARGALSRFVAELIETGVVADPRPASLSGGMIPVGGQGELRRGNVILAGDAAGQCHPVTGAGVPNAVFAGRLAGEAAARAAGAADTRMLEEYEDSCRLFLGDTLKRAAAKRSFLAPYWNESAPVLSDALRKGWIAFDGYYEN